MQNVLSNGQTRFSAGATKIISCTHVRSVPAQSTRNHEFIEASNVSIRADSEISCNFERLCLVKIPRRYFVDVKVLSETPSYCFVAVKPGTVHGDWPVIDFQPESMQSNLMRLWENDIGIVHLSVCKVSYRDLVLCRLRLPGEKKRSRFQIFL